MHPMLAELTKQLMSFSSKSQGALYYRAFLSCQVCFSAASATPIKNRRKVINSDSLAMSTAGYLEDFPELIGQQFGDLCVWFDDAIVMGLVNRRTGACQITPDPTTVVIIHVSFATLFNSSMLSRGLGWLGHGRRGACSATV